MGRISAADWSMPGLFQEHYLRSSFSACTVSAKPFGSYLDIDHLDGLEREAVSFENELRSVWRK